MRQFLILIGIIFLCSNVTRAQTNGNSGKAPVVSSIEQDSMMGMGFLTTKEAYGFDGQEWVSVPITGLGVKMIGSEGTLGVMSTKEAYAFDGKKWHTIATTGLEVDIIGTRGTIGVLTTKEAYGFDGKQWVSTPLTGLVNKILDYNGGIMILTTKMVYHFSQKTGKWTTTGFKGLYIQYPK